MSMRAVLLTAILGLFGCATGEASDPPAWPADGSVRDATSETSADSTGEASPADTIDDGANPCMGVSCTTPPANECADATNLRTYATVGTCDMGKCSYTASSITCPSGCSGGKCTSDPCLGVTCGSPPKAYCSDSTHLTRYVSPGTCSGGTCSYTTEVVYCGFGCTGDVCTGDPCASVTCDKPPASYCSGPNNLVVYDATGSCSAGTCTYGNRTEYCSFGCAGGKCSGDPCSGVTCTTPPASYCSGANTLRTFAATGTCSTGTCTYAPTDKTCVGGCVAGVCKDCSAPSDCGSGKTCTGGTCVTCDSITACGPTCSACSGATPVCAGITTGCTCTSSPDSCGGTTSWCNTSGACVACSTGSCGNGRCDCGETSSSCAADCGPACPTGLSLGTFDAGTDGWTFDGLWRRDSTNACMVAGSTTKYSSSYTQNLTNGSDVNLSGCTSATLNYRVQLADDPGYYAKGPDKSERLYVQCSGDSGATWTNLTPTSWPVNQSACATSYCCGGPGAGRSFPWTNQAAVLPASCRTATARVRFQAKGSSVWNLQNPGWYVDSVTVN